MGETKKVKTICGYCGTGCGLILEVKDNQITRVRGDKDAPVNQGQTCIKGALGYHYMHAEERLTEPHVRKGGKLVPTSWEEALSLVANKFHDIKTSFGSDALSIFACARATNETNFVTQKFARAVLGTNNIDGCNRT
ncbi:putative molibdopterin-dependent oxidoreductase YjgC [Texcoconibacillus texcoconensis]|nr:putative molibdopterin-dependent oxidoreductase YjgC [Texcoconibacillus texcoconensis]